MCCNTAHRSIFWCRRLFATRYAKSTLLLLLLLLLLPLLSDSLLYSAVRQPTTAMLSVFIFIFMFVFVSAIVAKTNFQHMKQHFADMHSIKL